LEWPTECDDEYWEDPVNPFVQPPGQPSKVEHFTQFIKLCIILGNTQRTIYANKKPRIFMNAKDDDWQRRVIMQLDSELNKWQDSLPLHLRWNPYEENPLKLEQSGTLHAYQHFIRISIHRPFISSDDDSAVPLPLLISTNAARALCQILYRLRERGIVPVPYVQAAGFVSGVILLLNLWASIRHNREVEWDKEMAYVDRCMSVMKYAELRWCTAGRFWDILNQLRWIPMDENHIPQLIQQPVPASQTLPPMKVHPPMSMQMHPPPHSGPSTHAGQSSHSRHPSHSSHPSHPRHSTYLPPPQVEPSSAVLPPGQQDHTMAGVNLGGPGYHAHSMHRSTGHQHHHQQHPQQHPQHQQHQHHSPHVHTPHLPPLQGSMAAQGYNDAYLDAYPGYNELPSSFGGLDESQLMHATQNLASTYSFPNCESHPVSLQDMMTMVMDSSSNYAP
jgi:hypothetical protein